MRTISIFVFICSLALTTYSQEDNLQFKLDSILKEAELLYRYEKAAWIGSDLIRSDKKLKKNLGGYIISHSNDTIIATFPNKDQNEVIARYYFTNSNLETPYKVEIQSNSFTEKELEYLRIKKRMIDQLSDSKYEVRFYENFDPNFIFIKGEDEYKLYIVMATKKAGVIPFGNDYLFISDMNGEITNWRKFHKIMIPTDANQPGANQTHGLKLVSTVHLHVLTPYISATDICLFRLYAPSLDINELKVIWPETNTVYTYTLDTNKIEVSDLKLD